MSASAGTEELRVIVVDDDAGVRNALHRLFRAEGIAVEAYDSATALLARGDLEHPAVLVLDIQMPGMTGLELQSLLVERGSSPPIVFLTGASSVPLAVTAMRRGAADFVEKPFDNADLVRRVRGAAAGAPRGAAPSRRHDCARRIAALTPREREVMALVVAGHSNKEVARKLAVSPRTVEVHRLHLMEKLEAGSLAELVRMALAADGT